MQSNVTNKFLTAGDGCHETTLVEIVQITEAFMAAPQAAAQLLWRDPAPALFLRRGMVDSVRKPSARRSPSFAVDTANQFGTPFASPYFNDRMVPFCDQFEIH